MSSTYLLTGGTSNNIVLVTNVNFSYGVLMKKHEASHSVKSLKKIFEYNLRFRDSATCEDMIANKQYDSPHVLISDQGSEFKSEFQEFFNKKLQKSYTPQPYIEAVNGVLRNIIPSHVIRIGSKTLNHDISGKTDESKEYKHGS